MKRTGIGGFPCYDVQAKTREQVIKAMLKKKDDLTFEVAFYDAGLKKIKNLSERTFYELTFNGNLFLVQCWKFGRDHVEFRIFTCEKELGNPGKDHISLSWNWEWKATPVDSMNAVLYVNHMAKTPHFDKLLQGTYRSLKKE
jgi:hypothetical protein